MQRPWATLGLWLFLVDLVLVRWQVKHHIPGIDGLIAAAVLASMVWATVFVLFFCIRTTLAIVGSLWSDARRS